MIDSKTIRLALVFAVLGATACLLSSIQRGGPTYVPEYFILLSTMFLGVCGKNGADNYISYKRDTVPTPPPLPGSTRQGEPA